MTGEAVRQGYTTKKEKESENDRPNASHCLHICIYLYLATRKLRSRHVSNHERCLRRKNKVVSAFVRQDFLVFDRYSSFFNLIF